MFSTVNATHRVPANFLLLFLVVVSWPEGARPLHAQTTLQRDPSIGQVTFSRKITLGDKDGPGFIGLPANVAKRHSGEWVITDQNNPEEIKFFSPDGTWLRTIGRRGEGPGEFHQAWSIEVLPDDGLQVFDPGLARVSQFGPALKVLSTAPVRVGATSLAFLPDNQVVVGARLNGPSEVGLPLHLLDSQGRVSRSFGASPPIQDWGNRHKDRRTLAPSGHGAVWAGQLTQYTLERWTVDGDRTHLFVGEVPWFEPHERFGRQADRSGPPGPGIYAVHEDACGLVWLAIRVPDENWMDAYEPGRDRYGRESWVARDDNELYDTIIEVIDPTQGKVIASGRHPLAVWSFTNRGELVFSRFLEGSTPTVEIWEARF